MGKVSAGRKGAKQSKETGERSNGNCFRPTLQVVLDLDRSVPTNEHLVIHFWIVGQPEVVSSPVSRLRSQTPEVASRSGCRLPRVEVIEVSDWLIEHTEGLRIELGGSKIPCRSGKELGSLYVGCESPTMTFDYLPRELLQKVANASDFPRVLVLDKWTGNSDGRQAIFFRKTLRSQRHHATFIDQGYCFNASEWSFADCPFRGVTRTIVYTRVSRDGRYSNPP
jgi:hypothetical protein